MFATVRNAAVLVLTCLLLTPVAVAQNNRSAVSITGLDTNTCTVSDPCRTFGAAIARTNSGAEIIVLSSGGYGPFTIDKSVAIISPGGIHAALAPAAGTAITVNGAGIDVFLRNLWINSLGGNVGIDITNARQVHVENCTVTGFGSSGIYFSPVMSGFLSVKDSFLRLNADAILLNPPSGAFLVTVDRTRIENNSGRGIYVVPQEASVMKTVVKDSLITSNSVGIKVFGIGTSETNVEQCVVAHNVDSGLHAGGDATRLIRVSETYITNNGTGVSTGGVMVDDMRSFGNNRIQGNTVEGTFTSTIPLR